MLLYFYSTYITQCHFDSTSVETNSQRRKTSRIQLDRIAELTWNPELITEIAVQIQDKFKLATQGI